MPDEPAPPAAPNASVENTGQSEAAKTDPAYQQYLKYWQQRRTKPASPAITRGADTTRLTAPAPLAPRTSIAPAAPTKSTTPPGGEGVPQVEQVSAAGGAEAKKVGPQEVEIDFKTLFPADRPLPYRNWLALLASYPRLLEELAAAEATAETAAGAESTPVELPAKTQGEIPATTSDQAGPGATDMLHYVQGRRSGESFDDWRERCLEAADQHPEEWNQTTLDHPDAESDELLNYFGSRRDQESFDDWQKRQADDLDTAASDWGQWVQQHPDANVTDFWEYFGNRRPGESFDDWQKRQAEPTGAPPAPEEKPGQAAPGTAAPSPPKKSAQPPPAEAAPEVPGEVPATPAEELSRPPPTEEAPLVRQDEAGQPLPAETAPGAPPKAPPPEAPSEEAAPAPPRTRSLRDALANAAQLESGRAKLKRARDKFQTELDELEQKLKGVSASRYLRVLRFFMPKLHAQISGAFATGKNVAGQAKIIALEARLVKLKSAKAALEVGQGVGSIVDASKALIEFIGATSGTIIIPILAILAFPLIVFVLALVYTTVGGGTITRAMKKLIEQVDALIKPLQKLLNKEKRKIQLRQKIQQIDTALAQRRVLPLRPGLAPREADNNDATPPLPQRVGLGGGLAATSPRPANDNATPEAGAGGSREAPRLAA